MVAFANSSFLAGQGRLGAWNWGRPGTPGSRGGFQERGPRLGLLICILHLALSLTRQRVGAGGLSGRTRAALDVPVCEALGSGSSSSKGLCCALLACLSRVSLVNRPDLLPRLNA